MAEGRDELARRVVETALLRGTFTLRSGRTSSYYLDKYRLTTEPTLLASLADRLAVPVETGTDKLAGAELGGVPLVTAASLWTGLPCVFVRTDEKDYGTENLIEGRLAEGERVVLLEDVCTSGGQILEAAASVERAGGEVVKIVAAIDREEGARERIESAGYRFEAVLTRNDLGL